MLIPMGDNGYKVKLIVVDLSMTDETVALGNKTASGYSF